jgi:hypothetical protein
MRKETRRKARRSAPTQEAPETTVMQAEASPESAAPASEQPDERTAARVAIPLNDDGTADVDSMRGVTKERLRVMLSDPSLASKLGLAAANAVNTSPSLFDVQVCGILYDTAGTLLRAYAIKAGYPVEQTSILRFTEQEKEVLCPLTGRVLDKWIPTSGKYQDEAMLALALFGIVSGKMSALKKPAQVIHMQPRPEAEQTTEQQP